MLQIARPLSVADAGVGNKHAQYLRQCDCLWPSVSKSSTKREEMRLKMVGGSTALDPSLDFRGSLLRGLGV